MEVFYAFEVAGGMCWLDAEESAHCTRVLRHRAGDEVHVIDGAGTMYRCTLVSDSPKGAEAAVVEAFPDWGGHPYRLTVACCPTKNNDRFEWFVEKATELGVDRIVPVIGDRSERRIYKSGRARKIALSAAKQSLKARIPEVSDALSLKDFLRAEGRDDTALRLIACCFEDESPRVSVRDALAAFPGREVSVLIGPEGDFTPEEVRLAVSLGYRPVHLGASRLRTETAAVTATAAVYLHFLK